MAVAAKKPLVNFITALRALKQLESSADFNPTTKVEFAEKIAEKLGVDRKSPDWAAIIDLIIKFLPLLLLLI